MKNRLVLPFLLALCVIVFAPQVCSANVDTTAAYQTVFGRPATPAEIAYWQNRLPASQTELIEINLNWLVSPAGAKDLKETVVRGFQQVFQRSPTAAEQQEWENKIKASRLKYQDLVIALKGPMPVGTKAAVETPVNLICSQFAPSQATDVHLSFQKTTILTTAGPQDIYAPTDITVVFRFEVATEPAGLKGEKLKPGQCGLATSVLTGVSPQDNATIHFYHMKEWKIDSGEYGQQQSSRVTGQLTDCSIYSLDAMQAPVPRMFNVYRDDAVKCLQ